MSRSPSCSNKLRLPLFDGGGWMEVHVLIAIHVSCCTFLRSGHISTCISCLFARTAAAAFVKRGEKEKKI